MIALILLSKIILNVSFCLTEIILSSSLLLADNCRLHLNHPYIYYILTTTNSFKDKGRKKYNFPKLSLPMIVGQNKHCLQQQSYLNLLH